MTAAPDRTSFVGASPERAITWAEVTAKGTVRKRPDGLGWYVDLRPHARIYVVPGIGRLETKRDAKRVLEHVRAGLWRGEPIEFVLATYQPKSKKPQLVEDEIERWLRVQRGRCEAGQLSPTYLRELERYAKPGGYFSWWYGWGVPEIQYGRIQEWLLWLAQRGIAAKTQRHARDTLRTFLRWELRSAAIPNLPDFPTVTVPEHAPTLLPLETQDAILRAIPAGRRGAFLAMARLGLRPGEVRALDVDDYRVGDLRLDKAMKGGAATAPIGQTKTGASAWLPVWDEETRAWLEERVSQVTAEDRLSGPIALFPNPRARHAAKRWTTDSLEDEWNRACRQVGVRCSLYEGTKHSFATAMLEAGVPLKVLKEALRHRDIRSTERYAKMRRGAVVSELSVASKRARKSAKRKAQS